ncbi:MAG: RNA polymerase sigma factor [Myxococcota bacterium]
MPTPSQPVELADFLAEAAWLRRLAGRLVAPEHADDVVQDTWAHLASKPPSHSASPRGWLSQVARNAARMRGRAGARRRAREGASSPASPPPDPEELVARSQRLRLLARLVEALDEPIRTTVLLHYFEGSSLADIARQTDTPSATVRWRLSKGLTQLRVALDKEHDGDRMVWLSAFAPLGMVPEGGGAQAGTGVGMSAFVKVAAVAVVVGAGGAGMAVWDGEREARDDPTAVVATSEPDRALASGPAPTRARKPTLPAKSSAGRPLFANVEQRREAVAAVRAARVQRLRDAGIADDVLAATKTDAQLLGDIETMMMLEDAATLAVACVEASPPESRGVLYTRLELIGEAGTATLVDDVVVDDTHSEVRGAFVRCLRESLFLLSLAPPAGGGAQSLALFFDTDHDPVLVGEGSYDG